MDIERYKNRINLLLIVIGILGIALSAYLWRAEVVNKDLYCPTNGCMAVMYSDYSKFLGFPVAGWGVVYYVTVIGMAGLRYFFDYKGLKWLFAVQVLWGLGFTLYLRYLELFVLHEICAWCWVSVGLVAVLVVLLYLESKESISLALSNILQKSNNGKE